MSKIELKHACPPTILCDIRGTIWSHENDNRQDGMADNAGHTQTLLPGVSAIFAKWKEEGFFIILMTGRPEFLRRSTGEQLQELGIPFDKLIMGCGPGPRVLINDSKEGDRAYAINLETDLGLSDVNIEYGKVK